MKKKIKDFIKEIIKIIFDYDSFNRMLLLVVLSLCGIILFGICMFFPGLHIYVKKPFFISVQIVVGFLTMLLIAFILHQILEKIIKKITKGKEATLSQAILFSVGIFIFLLLLLIIVERIATGNFF